MGALHGHRGGGGLHVYCRAENHGGPGLEMEMYVGFGGGGGSYGTDGWYLRRWTRLR